MYRLAIYGKGGIGKSTTTCNIFHLSGGSMQTDDDCGVVDIVRAIRAAGHDDVRIVVNCGASFDDAELAELKRLGVIKVFSTFETTNPELFARVKPGDDLELKMAFARRIAAAGLGVGSGLMAGLGPREDAWANYAKGLADLRAIPNLDTIYISKFHHAPGILMNDHPECPLPEALSLLAMARLALRDVQIRAAAGWGRQDREAAVAAGAGCITIGAGYRKRASDCFGAR